MHEVSTEFLKGFANYAVTQRNFSRAEEFFDKILKREPTDAFSFNARGFCKHKQNKWEAALKDYDIAIELEPKNPDFFYNRGQVKQELGRYAKAIEDYHQAIKHNPSYHFAFSARGFCLNKLSQDNFEKAMSDFDKAINLAPTEVTHWLARGMAWQDLRSYEKAIADFNQVLGFEPNNADIYLLRGLSYKELGKFMEATQDLEKALTLNPEIKILVYCSFAAIKKACNEEVEAINYYNKALNLNPNYIEVLVERGLLYQKFKNNEEAKKDFERVLNLTADNDKYFYRARAQAGLSEWKDAITNYTLALKAEGSNNQSMACISMLVCRGKAYSELKEIDLAMQDFESALKLPALTTTQKDDQAQAKGALKELQELKTKNETLNTEEKVEEKMLEQYSGTKVTLFQEIKVTNNINPPATDAQKLQNQGPSMQQ